MSLNPFANKAELESAQSQIASLNDDLTTLQAELATERDVVASHVQTITGLQDQVSTLTAEREQFETQATQAQSRITELEKEVVTANESASLKASELLASSGHVAPVDAVDAQNVITQKEKTREEFNAMDHIARNQFIQNGGKITA